jgi:hypothetical protein
MFPIFSSYGHIVMQAQRGDVDTVVIDGNILKNERKLVGIDLAATRSLTEKTVSYLVDSVGEAAWIEGQNPELSAHVIAENPYKYVK